MRVASSIYAQARFERTRRRAALALLVLVAVGGYLIGHYAFSRNHRVTPVRSTLVANVVLEYPSTWRVAPSAPIAGTLPLAHASVFAPRGRAAQAGLLVGSLHEGEQGPLPQPFLRALGAPLHTAVVSLSELQAYRYSGVRIAGFAGALVVFSIPVPDRAMTVAACYSQSGAGAKEFMRSCTRAVSGLSELGQSESYDLAPAPAYARGLGIAIGGVEHARARAAAAPPRPATADAVRALASGLSAAFSHATAALAALEAPAPVRGAHGAMLRALARASSAYAALAAAAANSQGLSEAEAWTALAPQRTRARAAEATVDEALQTFALLGYGDARDEGAARASTAS
jgi:hypothetical protein